MKEYTVLAILSLLFTLAINKLLKTKIFGLVEYWVYLAFILLAEFVVNGFITGQGIVLYNYQFFMGKRLGTIPVEDFLFGFSMVTLAVIFWEFFKKKGKCEN